MAKRKRTVRRAKTTRRRSTRKGQVRRTRKAGRRAYVGTKQARAAASRRRRSARRNPALFRSPAVRYSVAALAGAAAASILDANAREEGWASMLQIPIGQTTLSAGVAGALLTLGITRVFKFKAQTRANATALAVGMLAPAAIQTAQNLASGAMQTKKIDFTRAAALSAPRRMPVSPSFNSAEVFVSDLIPA